MFVAIAFHASLSNTSENLKSTHKPPSVRWLLHLPPSQTFMPHPASAIGHLFLSDTNLICTIMFEGYMAMLEP